MTDRTARYRTLTRMSGYWDIVLMLPFLLPGVAHLALELISTIDSALQLPGTIGTLTPFHMLFVNMFAALTIVWSVRRVRSPEPIYGYYDGVSRILIFLLMVTAMVLGASMILVVFALAEIVWAFLQITGYYQLNRKHAAYDTHQ